MMLIKVDTFGGYFSIRCGKCGKHHTRKIPTWITPGIKQITVKCGCDYKNQLKVEVRHVV